MGVVRLARRPKKLKVRVDVNGNVIDPITGELVAPNPDNEKVDMPTQEQLAALAARPPSERMTADEKNAVITGHPVPAPQVQQQEVQSEGSPLQRAIATKVQEAVAKEISKIDIGGMISKAIEEAFK